MAQWIGRVVRICGVAVAVAAGGGFARAEPLAVCGPQAGRAFYVEGGAVPANASGWQDDRISEGKVTLNRNADGKFDIVYADATGGVFSSTAEGGIVIPNRLTRDEAIVVVAYPGLSVEVYHFVRSSSGQVWLLHTQSKGVDVMHKGALLVGRCSFMAIPAK